MYIMPWKEKLYLINWDIELRRVPAKQPKVLSSFFLLPIVKYEGKLKKKKKKVWERLFKKKTELADLEIFQSFKMTEDAKINVSQARSYLGHWHKVV